MNTDRAKVLLEAMEHKPHVKEEGEKCIKCTDATNAEATTRQLGFNYYTLQVTAFLANALELHQQSHESVEDGPDWYILLQSRGNALTKWEKLGEVE